MRSNTPSPPAPPPVPEGVDDVRRQADARETAAEGSGWLVRGSASEIGREGLGATMATLSRADLDALRLTENDGRETDGSGRAATSAVDDIARQRWWLSVVAQTFLQTDGKELPSWWTPADFTSPSSSVAESDEEVCRAVAGPFEQDGPWVRLATGIGWVRALGECGDGQCSTCRLAAPGVRRTFVDLVVRRTVRQLGAGGACHYCTIGCGLLLTDLQILSGLRAAGVRIATVVAVDSHFAEICTATAEAGPAPDTKASRRLRLLRRASGCNALAQLASYVAPARVIALSSVESLVDACAREPAVYAQMTTLVQIDTAEIKRDATRLAAATALSDAGRAFILNNTNEAHGAAAGSVVREAATVVWQRTCITAAQGGGDAEGEFDAEGWLRAALVDDEEEVAAAAAATARERRGIFRGARR